MLQYRVRSGQNIYDVAVTLYGSVEGVFDLLASNPQITIDTTLTYGMVLNYHEEFVINKDIVNAIGSRDIIVKNGEHVRQFVDIEDFVRQHIEECHPDTVSGLEPLSPDEQDMFWEGLYTPGMAIHQEGSLSSFSVSLKEGCHLIVDWGDFSGLQTVEGDGEIMVEHLYKGEGPHTAVWYGDFACHMLDITEINGIHYPLREIVADSFKSKPGREELNKLIITR